jgi:hypothetical protein
MASIDSVARKVSRRIAETLDDRIRGHHHLERAKA